MFPKQDDSINLNISELDFSNECPKFREQLFKELILASSRAKAVPLNDQDLEFLNAAGPGTPSSGTKDTLTPPHPDSFYSN